MMMVMAVATVKAIMMMMVKCMDNMNSILSIMRLCGDCHCSQREYNKDEFVHGA
jgi:hypothetical protein